MSKRQFGGSKCPHVLTLEHICAPYTTPTHVCNGFILEDYWGSPPLQAYPHLHLHRQPQPPASLPGSPNILHGPLRSFSLHCASTLPSNYPSSSTACSLRRELWIFSTVESLGIDTVNWSVAKCSEKKRVILDLPVIKRWFHKGIWRMASRYKAFKLFALRR